MQKDTPYSELRFKIKLNQSTSPSGHTGRFQNMESITTVTVRIMIPPGIPIWNNLKQSSYQFYKVYLTLLLFKKCTLSNNAS